MALAEKSLVRGESSVDKVPLCRRFGWRSRKNRWLGQREVLIKHPSVDVLGGAHPQDVPKQACEIPLAKILEVWIHKFGV